MAGDYGLGYNDGADATVVLDGNKLYVAWYTATGDGPVGALGFSVGPGSSATEAKVCLMSNEVDPVLVAESDPITIVGSSINIAELLADYNVETGIEYFLGIVANGGLVLNTSGGGYNPGTAAQVMDFDDPFPETWTGGGGSDGLNILLWAIAGETSELVIADQPVDTTVDADIPSISVEVQQEGVVDTSFTGNVTVALQAGTGTLSGTLTVAAVAGVATFDDLSIDTIGTGKVLRFTASGMDPIDSNAFAIVAASVGFWLGGDNAVRDIDGVTLVNATGVRAVIRTSNGASSKLDDIADLALIDGEVTIESDSVGSIGDPDRWIELTWTDGEELKYVAGYLPIVDTSA